MHFLKAGLPGDGGGSVLVQGPKVAGELELLLDADFLVAEDCNKCAHLSAYSPYRTDPSRQGKKR